MRNLRHFGYGVKGFALSMIETAIEITEGRVTAREIADDPRLGQDDARATGRAARRRPPTRWRRWRDTYPLMLLTKGDLLAPGNEARALWAGRALPRLEIVSEKDAGTYRSVMSRYRVDPAQFAMVGNSLRSDILPVLEAGGRPSTSPTR